MTAHTTTERRTDLRTTFPHGSYRKVFTALDCPDPAEIEPVDPVSSNAADAAVCQALKRNRRTSS